MKVLITGGFGFIGINFLYYILPKIGIDFYQKILVIDKVSYSTNKEEIKNFSNHKNIKFQKIDLCDSYLVNQTLKVFQPDLIINFAAESHVDKSIKDPNLIFHNNTISVINLLNSIIKNKLLKYVKFLHISTDEVFGSLDNNKKKFNYKSNFDPKSPYSASKAASEHIVNAWKNTYGLKSTIINCSNNYGPFQFPEKLIPLVINKCMNNEEIPVYGNGRQIRDWIHVNDHCAAIDSIVNNDLFEQPRFLIGGNSEINNLNLIKLICKKIEKKTNKRKLSSLISFIPDRPGHDFRYSIDISKTTKKIKWEPKIELKKGLDLTVDWYLNNLDWLKNKVNSNYYRNWTKANYRK